MSLFLAYGLHSGSELLDSNTIGDIPVLFRGVSIGFNTQSKFRNNLWTPLFLYIVIVDPDGIKLLGLASEAFGCDFVFANISLTVTGFEDIGGLKSN